MRLRKDCEGSSWFTHFSVWLILIVSEQPEPPEFPVQFRPECRSILQMVLDVLRQLSAGRVIRFPIRSPQAQHRRLAIDRCERVREAEKIGHNEAVEVLLETSFERPADPSKAMNILNELIGMLGWGRLVANEGGSSGRCRKLEATEFLV